MLAQLAFLFSDSVEEGAVGGGIGWGLAAFAVVIIIMALMPRLIRRIRNERIALQKQEEKKIQNAPNIRSQADRILVDLAEMSREINAQVDVKIRVLNKLLRDSEEIVERYEKIVERVGKLDLAGFAESSCDMEKKGLGITDKVKAVKSITEEVSPKENSAGSVDLSSSLASKQKGNDSHKSKQDDPVEDSAIISRKNVDNWQNNIQAKVVKMFEEGRDVSEIARKTRLSIAEINLILSIYQNEL